MAYSKIDESSSQPFLDEDSEEKLSLQWTEQKPKRYIWLIPIIAALSIIIHVGLLFWSTPLTQMLACTLSAPKLYSKRSFDLNSFCNR